MLLKLFCHRQIADDFLTKARLVPIQHDFENLRCVIFQTTKTFGKKADDCLNLTQRLHKFWIKNFNPSGLIF
jgi:hypothetical protein